MGFILKVRGFFYLAERTRSNGKRRNKIIRRATAEEIKTYQEQRELDLVTVSCDNPSCDHLFKITRKQKIFLNVINPRHRNTLEFKHCSLKCKEEHLKALGVVEIK